MLHGNSQYLLRVGRSPRAAIGQFSFIPHVTRSDDAQPDSNRFAGRSVHTHVVGLTPGAATRARKESAPAEPRSVRPLQAWLSSSSAPSFSSRSIIPTTLSKAVSSAESAGLSFEPTTRRATLSAAGRQYRGWRPGQVPWQPGQAQQRQSRRSYLYRGKDEQGLRSMQGAGRVTATRNSLRCKRLRANAGFE